MSSDRNTSLTYNNQPNQSTAGTEKKKGGAGGGNCKCRKL